MQHSGEHIRSTLFSPYPVNGLVTSHGQQPAAESAPGWIPTFRVIPNREKGILRDFFGYLPIGCNTQREAIDHLSVALVQFRQRILVSLSDTVHQLPVTGRCLLPLNVHGMCISTTKPKPAHDETP